MRPWHCTVKLTCKVNSISIMMVAEDIRSPRSMTTRVCISSWYISQLTLEITIMLWKCMDLVAAYWVNTSIIVMPLSHQCLSNSLRDGNGMHIIPSHHFVVWLLDQWISTDPDHVLLSTPDYMMSKCWDLDSGLWWFWKTNVVYCFSWFKVCNNGLKFSLEYSQRLHRPCLFTGLCHTPKVLFMLSAASSIVCCFHLPLVPSMIHIAWPCWLNCLKPLKRSGLALDQPHYQVLQSPSPLDQCLLSTSIQFNSIRVFVLIDLSLAKVSVGSQFL